MLDWILQLNAPSYLSSFLKEMAINRKAIWNWYRVLQVINFFSCSEQKTKHKAHIIVAVSSEHFGIMSNYIIPWMVSHLTTHPMLIFVHRGRKSSETRLRWRSQSTSNRTLTCCSWASTLTSTTREHASPASYRRTVTDVSDSCGLVQAWRVRFSFLIIPRTFRTVGFCYPTLLACWLSSFYCIMQCYVCAMCIKYP